MTIKRRLCGLCAFAGDSLPLGSARQQARSFPQRRKDAKERNSSPKELPPSIQFLSFEKLGYILILLVLLTSFASSGTMAQKRKTVVDLIVRGGTVVSMDGSRRVIENGAIAIKGGRIE